MTKDLKGKLGLPRIWLFVLLILGALIVGDLNERMVEARRLEKEAALLEGELSDLKASIAELQEEIERANNEGYIELWAHRDAKMVRPGEHLVIFVGPEEAEITSSTSNEATKPEVKTNFGVWLELIFGH